MWVLADSPMLEALCGAVDGPAAPVGPSGFNQPLLVFAHARLRQCEPRRDGGLRELERMLAASPPHQRCRVAIVGFLPFWEYGQFKYLIGRNNYWQLPCPLLPRTVADYDELPVDARSIATANNLDPDVRRACHDINDCLRIAEAATDGYRLLIPTKLERLRRETVIQQVTSIIDDMIQGLREDGSEVKAILERGAAILYAKRNF